MEKVQIIPPPKDVDPRVLAWKGAAVLGKMDGVADLWVSKADWVRSPSCSLLLRWTKFLHLASLSSRFLSLSQVIPLPPTGFNRVLRCDLSVTPIPSSSQALTSLLRIVLDVRGATYQCADVG